MPDNLLDYIFNLTSSSVSGVGWPVHHLVQTEIGWITMKSGTDIQGLRG